MSFAMSNLFIFLNLYDIYVVHILWAESCASHKFMKINCRLNPFFYKHTTVVSESCRKVNLIFYLPKKIKV